MLINAFLLGMLLGVIYEGIRFLKFLFTSGRNGANVFLYILTFLTDFLFILLFATVAILQTYKMSGGVFRGFVYLGMFFGLMLYYFTIGKLTAKISAKMASFIRKTVKGTLRFICIPLRAIFLLIFKIYILTIGKIIGKIRCRVQEKRSRLQPLPETAELPAKATCKRDEGYKKEGRVSFGGKRQP